MATELPADVDELRKMLKQRDAEIEKLQRKLEPQPSWGEIVVKSFTSSKGGSANASSTSLDKSAPTSTAPTVVAVEEEEPKDPTAGAITALEPLLAQVQVWQLELAQHAATGGAAVEKAVAPVAAALQEWQETTVAPLVAQGGDAVKVAVAPLIEALLQLLAKLDTVARAELAKLEPLLARSLEELTKLQPYYDTAAATTAVVHARVQAGVVSAVDAVKALLVTLAPYADAAKILLATNTALAVTAVAEWNAATLQPLALQAGAALKVQGEAAAKAVGEWNETQLQPWAAQAGEALKAQAAALPATKAVAEWNETQLQPWMATTVAPATEALKAQAAAGAAKVQEWNTTSLQPWVATVAAPATSHLWLETLRCFCIPLSAAVGMAGLKAQAAQLRALAPEDTSEQPPVVGKLVA